MTVSASTLPSEFIACVSEGREATIRELHAVAERIWADGASERSAFAWGTLSIASPQRLAALQAAHLALRGDANP